ncbi:hypothetical protein DL770_004707 [Monosporascus sp. CRB-9-2]|nr:hypothetical protein DL770_004707 [Monosporascus sp. CRB-9-2]
MTGRTSTGRGGAGNIADSSKSPKLNPADLQTPTLKGAVYTTGRGGSGNMATNTDPIEARIAQDVEPIERQPSTGPTHVGRGGAANIARRDSGEVPAPAEIAKAKGASDEHKKDNQHQHQGLAEKAKGLFKKA